MKAYREQQDSWFAEGRSSLAAVKDARGCHMHPGWWHESNKVYHRRRSTESAKSTAKANSVDSSATAESNEPTKSSVVESEPEPEP